MKATPLPINDQPLNSALARKELNQDLQNVFGIDHQQASLLCLAVLVMLVEAHQNGELEVQVPGGTSHYHVNGQPLQPAIQALAPYREKYLMQQHNPALALANVQRWLKESLCPRAVRTPFP